MKQIFWAKDFYHASNITNAVIFSENEPIRCSAHTLNLCVKDVLEKDNPSAELKKILKTFDKCRKIAGFFKISSKALTRLRAIQRENNLDQLKFVQEVFIIKTIDISRTLLEP
jgi:hypothetical protein